MPRIPYFDAQATHLYRMLPHTGKAAEGFLPPGGASFELLIGLER